MSNGESVITHFDSNGVELPPPPGPSPARTLYFNRDNYDKLASVVDSQGRRILCPTHFFPTDGPNGSLLGEYPIVVQEATE